MGIGETNCGAAIHGLESSKDTRFKVYLSDGKTDIVRGENLMDALTQAGYTIEEKKTVESFLSFN